MRLTKLTIPAPKNVFGSWKQTTKPSKKILSYNLNACKQMTDSESTACQENMRLT